MPTDKFMVIEETAKKLVEEFFTIERSSIKMTKYTEVDAEGNPFPTFKIVLKGKKGIK